MLFDWNEKPNWLEVSFLTTSQIVPHVFPFRQHSIQNNTDALCKNEFLYYMTLGKWRTKFGTEISLTPLWQRRSRSGCPRWQGRRCRPWLGDPTAFQSSNACWNWQTNNSVVGNELERSHRLQANETFLSHWPETSIFQKYN